MEKRPDDFNAYNDTHMHRYFWGGNFEYYRTQLNSGERRKWNWAAFFLTIPWLISKQLYKHAVVCSVISLMYHFITIVIEQLWIDMYWVIVPMGIVYILALGAFISRNANGWVIEHYLKSYGDGSDVKAHNVSIRVWIFVLITAVSALLNWGFGMLITAVHRIYVPVLIDSVNDSEPSPVLVSNEGLLFWASEKRDYESWHMTLYINRLNADGTIKTIQYKTDELALGPENQILFEYNGSVYHFIELQRDSKGKNALDYDNHILLYKWNKELTKSEHILIEVSRSKYINPYQKNDSILEFRAKTSESLLNQEYNYVINLDSMSYSKSVVEFVDQEKPKLPIEEDFSVPGSDLNVKDIYELLSGRIQIYKGDSVEYEFEYNTFGAGFFENVEKIGNYLVLSFSKATVIYSIVNKEIVDNPVLENALLYPGCITDSGYLFLTLKAIPGKILYIGGILFNDESGLPEFTEIDFHMYSGALSRYAAFGVENARIFNVQDSYILMYRTSFDTIALGRLSKNLDVLPFER